MAFPVFERLPNLMPLIFRVRLLGKFLILIPNEYLDRREARRVPTFSTDRPRFSNTSCERCWVSGSHAR